MHQGFARQYFGPALDQLFGDFSLVDWYTRISPGLDHFIAEQKKRIPDLANILAQRHANEPYRQALAFISYQLGRPTPPEQALQPGEALAPPQPSYRSGTEFLADMQRLVGSLQSTRETMSLAKRLMPLLRQVETFGLHTSFLDIRQHSSVHEAVIAELLQHSGGTAADYTHLSETDKSELLNHMLETASFPPIERDSLSPAAIETLDLFSLLQRVHQENPEALGCYLISLAQHASDTLEVLWLAGLVGLYRPQEGISGLDIAPLFETIADLERAWKPC
jgi:phosphoenolpyruvate carboxylase